MVHIGGTQVICAVHGPFVDSRMDFAENGHLACEVKFAAFSGIDQVDAQSVAALEQDSSEDLLQAVCPAVQLRRYPKTAWKLSAFVTMDDGGFLPAGVAAASLALAHATVLMDGLVTACSVVRALAHSDWSAGPDCKTRPSSPRMQAIGTSGLVANPTHAERRGARATVTVAALPALSRVTHVSSMGKCTPEAADQAIDVACEGCKALHAVLRTTLLEAERGQGQMHC